MRRWTQIELLHELEPVAARRSTGISARPGSGCRTSTCRGARVATSTARSAASRGSESSPGSTRVARTALVVNLLTEDNLPSYHREITAFGPDGAWGTWVGRWTAEEARHAIAIRDYLLTTRAVDPVALERERMVHMTQGFDSAYALRPAALGRVRVLPGAGHPDLAPQHRQVHRRPDLRRAAGPDRRRREPAHGLLPQPARGRDRARPRPGDCRRCGTSSHVPDARLDDRRLHPPIARDRDGGDLRPADPPGRGARPGAPAVRALGPGEPLRRGGAGPRELAEFMAALDARASAFEDRRAARQAPDRRDAHPPGAET